MKYTGLGFTPLAFTEVVISEPSGPGRVVSVATTLTLAFVFAFALTLSVVLQPALVAANTATPRLTKNLLLKSASS